MTDLALHCCSPELFVVCEADLYILMLYVRTLVSLPCSIKRYNGSKSN